MFTSALDSKLPFRVTLQLGPRDQIDDLQIGDRLWLLPDEVVLQYDEALLGALANLILIGGKVVLAGNNSRTGDLVQKMILLLAGCASESV
ncbi:MAG: hypothetical protein ACRYG8_31900 [Janthinobacterium lividum]